MLFYWLLLILGFVYLFFTCKKPNGLPPGKWGLPFVGSFPPIGVGIKDHLMNLGKQFGDIYTLKVGGWIIIYFTDYDLIKTALNKPELSGRPDFYSFKFFSYFKNIGLIGSERKPWEENRRFSLTHLRDLGLGKSRIQETIMDQTSALIKELDKNLEKPCELSWNINVAVLNVIWGMVASKYYDINDEELCHFAKLVSGNINIFQGPLLFLDVFPFLNRMPDFIKRKLFKIDQLLYARDQFENFMLKLIKEHEEIFDDENPRDYIDFYLREINLRKGDKDTTFQPDKLNLIASVSDLFAAGSETTSTTIRWGLLYLIKYPKIQEKIQKEIDEFVPKDTMPSLEYKNKLVYLEATIMEIQRKVSLLPTGVPHRALSDTTVAGYKIPKDAIIMSYQEFVHNDPKYWEKPTDFYPEHFIDEDGKLITKRPGFMAFSVGRRQCIGDNLAKMQLFIFMASLLQRYTISEPPGENLSLKDNRNDLIMNTCKPYNVILKKRI